MEVKKCLTVNRLMCSISKERWVDQVNVLMRSRAKGFPLRSKTSGTCKWPLIVIDRKSKRGASCHGSEGPTDGHLFRWAGREGPKKAGRGEGETTSIYRPSSRKKRRVAPLAERPCPRWAAQLMTTMMAMLINRPHKKHRNLLLVIRAARAAFDESSSAAGCSAETEAISSNH